MASSASENRYHFSSVPQTTRNRSWRNPLCNYSEIITTHARLLFVGARLRLSREFHVGLRASGEYYYSNCQNYRDTLRLARSATLNYMCNHNVLSRVGFPCYELDDVKRPTRPAVSALLFPLRARQVISGGIRISGRREAAE